MCESVGLTISHMMFQTNEVTTDWLLILLEIAFVNRFSEQ